MERKLGIMVEGESIQLGGKGEAWELKAHVQGVVPGKEKKNLTTRNLTGKTDWGKGVPGGEKGVGV